MNPNMRPLVAVVAACSWSVASSGCDSRAGGEFPTNPPQSAAVRPLEPAATSPAAEAELADYQDELLDLAFETATALPVEPHIKDRSRAQEEIVAAYLRLNQPAGARQLIEKIDNWRRGAAYADLAFYYAQSGRTDHVQQLLDEASQLSELAEDWRRDRIRVKIARVHALLGEVKQAREFAADAAESEAGQIEAAKAMSARQDDFDKQVRTLDELIATGNFDLVRSALEAYAQLFNRFYDDEARRTLAEKRIADPSHKIPLAVRIELIMDLADFALERSDQAKSLDLVNQAQAVKDSRTWAAEHSIPLSARLAGLRHRSGEPETARLHADAALLLCDSQKESILSVRRAETVRSVAEAYQAMGDAAAALSTYRKAIEVGAENPNARPRALDLAATCCSMAEHNVEPDASLWSRIRDIRAGLSDPW